MACPTCPAHGQWYCEHCAALAARAGISLPRAHRREPLSLPPAVDEKTLQGAVHTLCHDLHLIYYHAVKSQLSTPGLPDCLICHPDLPGPLFAWELKRAGAHPTPAQRRWLEALARVTHVETGVYGPEDWPTITRLLTQWR
jgi:hypothetical protein